MWVAESAHTDGGGLVYQVVIMDLYGRRILSWHLSNTMDARFYIDVLQVARLSSESLRATAGFIFDILGDLILDRSVQQTGLPQPNLPEDPPM